MMVQQLKRQETAFSITPGLTGAAQHSIDTGSEPEVQVPPYRIRKAWTEAVRIELWSMASLGVIVPSTSSWNAPIVCAKKKDGAVQVCLDYHKLNALTCVEPY